MVPLLAEHLPAYDILTSMDAGGQGDVFFAGHKATDRVVAIKVIPPEADGQPSQRALREARLGLSVLVDAGRTTTQGRG